ncbi:MAG: ABC transporter ATP-binding protein [Clostridia bacterium]|nr:ABC transporter ATP-binding protein [Clostridia bacterium]
MLELRHVCAGYGDGDVLKDVSCAIPGGGSWCVLGPNGCGKTTLLRVMAGLIPHRGEVLLDGVEIGGMKRRELASRIAVMSQINAVYFPYTVYDTVLLGRYQHMRGRLFGGPSAADREAVERCLESTGLADLKNRMIDELSGGQRQRVFLAQTLAQDPEIILLDEPTNHLDVRHQVELIDYLHIWCAQGGHTVIGVLHDVNLALRLSGSALFMREGRIERQGDFARIADGAFLQALYGMDLAGFMRDSLEAWKDL